jgi:N-acyl-D-aspartate/D-glutamate deacylase
MGIRDRGVLRERFIADLVIFNADTVRDNATYERPHQYPTGIEYVIVNGVLVLDPKGLTGARPGRALFGPARQP